MREIDEQFLGKGSVPIHWHAWLPEGDPVAVVVVSHGFGEHIGRYRNLVDVLVPRGYALYGPDHRGHGRSGGKRAFIDRYVFLLDDLDEVFKRVAYDHPGLPVFLYGHSMGANIALASALRDQARLRGLVVSGALASVAGQPAPLVMVSKLLGRVAPRLGVKKLDASGISHDPGVVKAYEDDPLVFHGSMPAGTAGALVTQAGRFAKELPSLRLPLLVVHGAADTLVPVVAGRGAHELAGSTDKTLKVYDGLAHEVHNEPEKAEVLGDIAAWLDAHR